MRLTILLVTALISLSYTSATAKTLVSSWFDFTLVGGFKVPATLIDGYNTRYASGSFDKRPGTNKWIAHHGVSGRIIEYIEPSDPDMTFPTLIAGRNGRPFTTVEYMEAQGVQWIDANQVLCSGRLTYSHPGTYNWVSIWNLNTGVETLQSVGRVDDTADWIDGINYNKLFHLHQALGGGFTRIPSDWAAANGLAGKNIGMAAGGYDALNSPMGPALGAFAIGDTVPTYLMDYPTSNFASDGQNHYEIRDKNYAFPTYINGNTQSSSCPSGSDYSACNNPIPIFASQPDFGTIQENPRLSGPTGDIGYFLADSVSNGAGWIDDSNYKGVVYGITSPNGYLDYDAQTSTFLVYNPSDFYDGSTAHYLHPTDYADGPTGSFTKNLYVYNPDCLAQVASGDINEWECTPTIITPDFSELPVTPVDRNKLPTRIGGVYWDNDRGYLWLVLTQMSGGNLYPMLVAYELKADRVADDLETVRPTILKINLK
ncbi:hypothetical protein [Desulfogranum marinum]|uniref:hypothetical protein n=1 Tax=Desulfogranum marinum TaxID=453220 RepID=UPI0019625A9C|nr:hypothetical protein [Desulfogranum marinum]MBM9513981.1 hypothetical protein [Desulfogranum marinum]